MSARHSRTMFNLQRRHSSRQNPPRPSSLRALDPRLVIVSVSADVAEDLPTLGEALGDGYAVVVDEPDAGVVAVVGPVGPVGVAFLRMAHPRPALLVVDRARVDSLSSAACLHAGADGYISRRSVDEVAACIRALARRVPAGATAAMAS
jgi:DNA-binding NarL/FixJ family response regulator